MTTKEVDSKRSTSTIPILVVALAIAVGLVQLARQTNITLSIIVLSVLISLYSLARDAEKDKKIGTITTLLSWIGYSLAVISFQYGQGLPEVLFWAFIAAGIALTVTGVFLVAESLQGLVILLVLEYAVYQEVWLIQLAQFQAWPLITQWFTNLDLQLPF